MPDAGLVLSEVRRRLFDVRDDGAQLQRYVAVGQLGAGGFGVVLEARDPELQRAVAIKLVHSARVPDPLTLLTEARALARVSHPNVVTVYDVGRYALSESERVGVFADCPRDGVFVVLELVRGPTLQEWLADNARPWRDVLDMFLQAGHGLAAAHAEGIVHRDFKPANVLIGPNGRPRVGDFGLAGESQAEIEPARDPKTPRTVAGTPAYMAPEVTAGKGGDERSDQFSFCVTLYEALTGRRPFRGSRVAIAKAKFTASFPALPRTLPRWLRAAVHKGLHPDPQHRFDSMHALLEALDWKRRQRQRRVALGLAAAVVATTVSFAGGALRGEASQCEDVAAAAEAIWSADAKATVRRAFFGNVPLPPAAQPKWDELSALIAERAEAIGQGRARTCGTDAEADGCLLERHHELADLVDAMAGGVVSGEGVDAAVALEAVSDLLPLQWCEDARRRRAFHQPPAEALRRESASLRLALARADLLTETAQPDQASAVRAAASRRAKGAGLEALSAELRVRDAGAAFDRGDVVVARELGDEALRQALRSGALAVALQAYWYKASWAPKFTELEAIVADAEGLLDGLGLRGTHLEYELLGARGATLYKLGNWEAALEVQARRDELAKSLPLPPTSQAIRLGQRANYLHAAGRMEEAFVAVNEAIAARDELGLPKGSTDAKLRQNRAILLQRFGRLQEAAASLEEFISIAVAIGSEDSLDVAHGYRSLCWLEGNRFALTRAQSACERALEVFQRVLPEGDRVTVRTRIRVASIAMSRGTTVASSDLDELVRLASRDDLSNRAAAVQAYQVRARAWAYAGDFDAAERDILEAIRIAQEQPAPWTRPAGAHLALVRMRLDKGDLDGSERALEQLEGLVDTDERSAKTRLFEAEVLGLRGELASRRGELRAAAALFDRSIGIPVGEFRTGGLLRIRWLAGDALVRTGIDPTRGFALVFAVAEVLEAEAPDGPLARKVERWLAKHAKGRRRDSDDVDPPKPELPG